MQIVSAFQLLQGKKVDNPFPMSISNMSSLLQPVQMIPYQDKDDKWRAWNIDWGEWQGIQQIAAKSKSISKNYRLANGVIDKNDYIPTEVEDETHDLVDILARDDDPTEVNELKFYPLVPQIIDLLVGEQLKRTSKVFPYAIDNQSKNEKLEKKKELLDQVLIQEAQEELAQQLASMGVDMNSDQAQQQLSVENIKTLPDVEKFMRKTYRGVVEEWSDHQINADRYRFRMDELETIGFRDSLVCDMEFWEIRLGENDYEPFILDPRYVFYHKSPQTRYVSQGNFAGHINMMTVADVIDHYGYMMSAEEIESLQQIMPLSNINYLLDGPNDGRYYDPTKTYEENQKGGSLQYRKALAFEQFYGPTSHNRGFLDQIIDNPDDNNIINRYLLRVTTYYWKSQRLWYFLSKIDENGELVQQLVTEDYKVTDQPLYDNTFYKDDSATNLIFGEHLEPIWTNDVWGGVKIGPNTHTLSINNPVSNGLQPIYLGIGGKKKPDRLPIQFKGTAERYGARLPIEGARFTERGSKSMSIVDRTKPFQIGYNMVNNQIADIIIDELGTVIVLDQNTLPQHSMGESWGKNNLAKTYVAMKNFQMLPLDTSITNTETGVNFQNLQSLDASQTKRLLGRVQLANHFKIECMGAIGITPERMQGGQRATQSATSVDASRDASFNQTERLFTQHNDYLMPRVWELMLQAAQYYHSTGSMSPQLDYINDKGDNILYELPQGFDLIPREVNVFCTTSFAARDLKQKLTQLAMQTSAANGGASIYDLGLMLTLDTPNQVLDALATAEQKQQQIRDSEGTQQSQLQQQQDEAEMQRIQEQQQFEASENQKDREAKILEAEITASKGNATSGTNAGNSYIDAQKLFQQQQEHSDKMNLERTKEANKTQLTKAQQDLQAKEINSREKVANTNLRIAREHHATVEAQKRKEAKKKK